LATIEFRFIVKYSGTAGVLENSASLQLASGATDSGSASGDGVPEDHVSDANKGKFIFQLLIIRVKFETDGAV
jgi:hypothetical protein